MILSKRLQYVADEIAYRRVADIGTDHGYLPIYLAQNGLCDYIKACDINPLPLESTKKNAKQYNVYEKIDFVLCSGLSALRLDDLETVVISGMGGLQIITILNDSSELVGSLKQLVIQPQRDIPEVRKAIHNLGFRIANECIAEEKNKIYNIINAIKGCDELYNDLEYEFGKLLLERKDALLKKQINKKAAMFKRIMSNYKKDSDEYILYDKKYIYYSDILYGLE